VTNLLSAPLHTHYYGSRLSRHARLVYYNGARGNICLILPLGKRASFG